MKEVKASSFAETHLAEDISAATCKVYTFRSIMDNLKQTIWKEWMKHCDNLRVELASTVKLKTSFK